MGFNTMPNGQDVGKMGTALLSPSSHRCHHGQMDAAPRFTLLTAIVCALLLLSCLPKPEEETEFPESERSIIVQMKTVEQPDSELEQRLAIPEVTIYGDGTLIVASADGGLLEGRLDDGEVRGLLDYLDGKGYFDFDYEQPRVSPPPAGEATYLFATTTLKQNAVRACALTSEPPEDAGGEWSQFRRLQDIRDRLLAIETESALRYEPEEWVLFVRPFPAGVSGPVPQEWPLPDIDLSAVVEGGGQTVLTAVQGKTLDQALEGGLVLQAQRFNIAYRPRLPFEENFPEFDLPPAGEGVSFDAPLAGCG